MYKCVKLICNHPWTIRQATRLNLMLLSNIKLKQANYKQYVIYTYIVTAKHSHKVYYVILLVDYNLILLNFFIIGDVKYPASTRLQVA